MKTIKLILIACIVYFTSLGVKASVPCYELVWADEFNDTTLNLNNWNIEVNGSPANNELEYYTARTQNISVGDTVLTISALKESYLGKAYTSGRINTSNKFSFQYGKIESRMKLPYGQGIWPAFWMLGNSIGSVGWPSCGEVDIMEMIGGGAGRDNTIHCTLHWGPVTNGTHPSYGLPYTLPSGKFADAYHTFTTEWSATTLTTYCDSVQYYTIDLSPAGLNAFKAPFFIILNLAVGGDWPGSPNTSTVFPQTLKVDYVRVYQTKAMVKMDGNEEVYASDTAVIYKLPWVSGWSYNWTIPVDAQVVGVSDSNIIKINWGCSDDTVKCDVTGGCGAGSYSMPVKIKQPVITGPFFFTNNETGMIFSFPKLHSTTYNWTVPSGASITSGQGTDSITVTWGTIQDSVRLDVTNGCGTSHYALKVWTYGEYPYPDPLVRHDIPGEFNATDYDYGGEGVAYHDHEVLNQGPVAAPRHSEGVDTELGDGGNPDVGWIVAGEWIQYLIHVTQDNLYAIKVRNGSASTLASIGPLHFIINGAERGTLAVTKTGAWSTFHDQVAYLNLTTADTLLRLEFGNGDFNISDISFFIDTVPPSVIITSTPVDTVTGDFKITMTFSEKVTGFTESDLNIINGISKAGSFKTANNIVFTDTITPGSVGKVTIGIDANVCTDLGLNENIAAIPDTVVYVLPTAIENSPVSSVNFYPNPVQGVLYYNITGYSGTSELSIYDMVGNLVYVNTFNDAVGNIDMSSFRTGAYILKVKMGNNVLVKKLLVK
jgi:beta-glucanase (GH16 family)